MFGVKELILKLTREKIKFDIDGVAHTNNVVAEMTLNVLPLIQLYNPKKLDSVWDFRTNTCSIPTKDCVDKLSKQRRAY